MKKKIGLFLIKGICILFIVFGIVNFVVVCNGEAIPTPSSPHDHSYKEVSTAGGTEGILCSLGAVCVGAVGLFCAKQEK